MKLNEAYANYVNNKTSDNYEVLGKALLSFVSATTRQNFKGQANADELEDIAGNAIIKVLEKLGSYRSEAQFHNWVTTIVKNEGVYYMRKEAKRMEQGYVGSESYEQGPTLNQKILIEQLVSKLDPPERVFTQLFLEGLSHEEIAKELKITEDAAKKRWGRIQERLRTHAGVELEETTR